MRQIGGGAERQWASVVVVVESAVDVAAVVVVESTGVVVGPRASQNLKKLISFNLVRVRP